MKIASLTVSDRSPLKDFSLPGLDELVVIGGPNRVGKMNILDLMLGKLKEPTLDRRTVITLAATTLTEKQAWDGQDQLNTGVPEEALLLRQFLQRAQKPGQLRSGVLNFAPAGMFEEIHPQDLDSKPNTEDLDDLALNRGQRRLQDVVEAIYRRVPDRSEAVEASARSPILSSSSQLDFGCSYDKFKEVFAELLPGKTLADLDEEQNQLWYRAGNATLPFDVLSSGEKEVVTVAFDFLLRGPQDSIILFEEPELYFRPELTYRLLQVLHETGARNQLLCCTHSAEIISAFLHRSVVFVMPPVAQGRNQSLVVNEQHPSAPILRLLGESVGVISLGRPIVFLQADEPSVDQQTYAAILGSTAYEIVLVPMGAKETIKSFASAIDTVLDKTIWGVDFFLLCDGDRTSALAGLETHPRVGRLSRFQLENYFLDERVLAKVFEVMGEPENSWMRRPDTIRTVLIEIAGSSLSDALREAPSFTGDGWKERVPGKALLQLFSARARLDIERLKTVYIREAARFDPHPFAEIQAIFRKFLGYTKA